MAITKGAGFSEIASTASTTTSTARDISADYLREFYISIVVVGTATTAANVQVQVSPDAGTTYYSPVTLQFTAGLAAGTYNQVIQCYTMTATKAKVTFTQQVGGTSSTCVVQSNDITLV